MTIEEAWEAIDEQTVLTDSSADKIRTLALAVLEDMYQTRQTHFHLQAKHDALRARIEALGT